MVILFLPSICRGQCPLLKWAELARRKVERMSKRYHFSTTLRAGNATEHRSIKDGHSLRGHLVSGLESHVVHVMPVEIPCRR